MVRDRCTSPRDFQLRRARQGIQPDNPVYGIVKFAEGWRQRRLTDDEYRQIGMALSGQPAIDATWLMIMTGW
jgi:hypothetical protein